jgi:hypothetical protein
MKMADANQMWIDVGTSQRGEPFGAFICIP